MASEKVLKRDERMFALEEKVDSPKDEKRIQQMSDEFCDKYLKKAMKDAQKSN